MIFAVPGHIEKIDRGEKTQTRRIAIPGDIDGHEIHNGVPNEGIDAVWNKNQQRYRYIVGHDYAAQPGRCKHAVTRIRILSLAYEDVRKISKADALAEGGYTPFEYLCLWTLMHDKENVLLSSRLVDNCVIFRNYPSERPAERYNAWKIVFEKFDGARPGKGGTHD